jgi:hypothetical protein
VAEARAGACETRADRADRDLHASRGPEQRRGDGKARTSPPKHGATATLASVRPRARNARSASESETASAPPCTWM